MEQQKIWDYFQSSKEHDVFNDSTPRYFFLAKKIPLTARVLNIGVGRGGLEKILKSRGVDISCLDPSENTIAKLRTELEIGDKARIGSAQKIPFEKESFDIVIMSEVLEHLDSKTLSDTLQEVLRVLTRNGKFIGTVPADENLSGSEAICPCCGNIFHRWGHIQSFSKNNLTEIMQSSGFAHIAIEYRAFPDWQRAGLTNIIKSMVRYILGRLGKSIASPSLFFSCTKK